MPGPVSDSYDPEFGTAAVAEEVADGIREVISKADLLLGPKLLNIVEVVRSEAGVIPRKKLPTTLTEREWRIIRFGLRRALESI